MRPSHVIVLMLENRSFDHLLGFLPHADPQFEGAAKAPGNAQTPGGPVLRPAATSTGSCQIGPDHSHAGVMRQLLGFAAPTPHAAPYRPDNSGFVQDYEAFCASKGMPGLGFDAQQCIAPGHAPALWTLAMEFAVCDHWFCSVPGETWPNRNFAHAATSDGEVNIHKRFYHDRTIFQELAAGGKEWAVYHHGTPQVLVFPQLWDAPLLRNNFKKLDRLKDAIHDDKLPHYAFVEPRHFGKGSNSQHPGNNEGSAADFEAGDDLVRDIYKELLDRPEVFEKTLFVITYDEHGGYYDHVPPPTGPALRDGREFRGTDGERFRFDLLGPRVPTVLVSPWIDRMTLDHTQYDHASIPATLRDIFGLAGPLPDRTRRAASFANVMSRATPRSAGEMPAFPAQPAASALTRREFGGSERLAKLDEFQESLVDLSAQVDLRLRQEEAARAARTTRARRDAVVPPLGRIEWRRDATRTTTAVFRASTRATAAPLEERGPAAFGDTVMDRLRRSTPQTVRIRTSDGRSIADAQRADVDAAVREVFAGARREMWGADQEDRSLTVRSGGAVELRLPDDDVRATRQLASPDEAIRLMSLLRAGDFVALRQEFGVGG